MNLVFGFLAVFVLGTCLAASGDTSTDCPKYDFKTMYDTKYAEYQSKMKNLNDNKPKSSTSVDRGASVSESQSSSSDGSCVSTITIVKEGKTTTKTGDCADGGVSVSNEVVKLSDGTCVDRSTITIHGKDTVMDGTPYDCNKATEEAEHASKEWEEWNKQYDSIKKEWYEAREEIARLQREDRQCRYKNEGWTGGWGGGWGSVTHGQPWNGYGNYPHYDPLQMSQDIQRRVMENEQEIQRNIQKVQDDIQHGIMQNNYGWGGFPQMGFPFHY